MAFNIVYNRLVVKDDIPSIPNDWKNKIRKTIENKLTEYPEIYGKPLRHSLKGYRRLRAGDYRIIFKIEKNIVVILAIKHRSVAYKELRKIWSQ